MVSVVVRTIEHHLMELDRILFTSVVAYQVEHMIPKPLSNELANPLMYVIQMKWLVHTSLSKKKSRSDIEVCMLEIIGLRDRTKTLGNN